MTAAAHGLVPLARVVDDQETRKALRIDASDEPSFDKLTRLITAASYLAGVGFAVGAILKFKAHKDNPRQTVLGKPTALVFIGASIPFIDKAAAIAGASVFGQASEARVVAADERNQAGATLTRSEPPRTVRPAAPPAPPPRTSSQNRRLRRLVALEHTQSADETRLARASHAEVTAVRHSSTAAKAGDRVAYSLDRTAVIRSLRQEGRLLEQLATMRHRAAATFADARDRPSGHAPRDGEARLLPQRPRPSLRTPWSPAPGRQARKRRPCRPQQLPARRPVSCSGKWVRPLPPLQRLRPPSRRRPALGPGASRGRGRRHRAAVAPDRLCQGEHRSVVARGRNSLAHEPVATRQTLCRDSYEAVGRSSFGA